MEKINIAELLKDCPKGMELYSPLFGDCKFVKVHDYESKIIVEIETGANVSFKTDGRYFDYPNAECILFPKGKTTWEGFQKPFKDGDILINGLEDYEYNPFIFKQTNGLGNAQCYCAINCFEELILNSDNWTPIKGCRLATEEEKQKLFQAIKDNGYVWNEETKSLEKLPKFKVGDRIKRKDVDDVYAEEIVDITQTLYIFKSKYWYSIEYVDKDYVLVPDVKPKFKVGDKIQYMGYKVKITEVNIEDECYEYESMFAKGIGSIEFSEQDNWELVPNKFDITNLKPFESKVLVRNSDVDSWCPAIFGCKRSTHTLYKYATMAENYYAQCIPYEGNEHLVGTKNDCDEYYKNW